MGGGGRQEIYYAEYLRQAHGDVMNKDGADKVQFSMFTVLNSLLNDSSYTGFEYYDIDDAFFGRVPGEPDRTYEISNFPSLFDMFGKFIAGLDAHVLWADTYEDTVHGAEIAAAVSAQSALLRHEVDTKVLPQFLAGMRDINAIQSTTFVIGKSIIAEGQVRTMNEFQSRLRLSAVDLSGQLWKTHLDWSRGVIATYADVIKLYYTVRMDTDRDHLEYKAKDKMWNLGLFEEARAMVGAMNGAAAATRKNEPSQGMKAASGALSGAAAGAALGPYGAIAGAVIGGLAGAFL